MCICKLCDGLGMVVLNVTPEALQEIYQHAFQVGQLLALGSVGCLRTAQQETHRQSRRGNSMRTFVTLDDPTLPVLFRVCVCVCV